MVGLAKYTYLYASQTVGKHVVQVLHIAVATDVNSFEFNHLV